MDPLKVVTGIIVLLGSGALLAKLVASNEKEDSGDKPEPKSAPAIERPTFRHVETKPGSLPNATGPSRAIARRIRPAALGRIRAS